MARLHGVDIDVALAMRMEDPGLSTVENGLHPRRIRQTEGSPPADDSELATGLMLPVRGARDTDTSS